MKNSLLIASLLAVMAASAVAQTAPAAAKPTVATKPATTPAAPAHPLPDPEQIAKHQIARFDTNKDGKVSQEEFLAPATDSFKRTDLNHDGFVTAAELVTVNQREMDKLIKIRDNMMRQAAPGAPAAPVTPVKPAK